MYRVRLNFVITDGGGDAAGEHVIDVGNEVVEFWNKLDETLWQHHHAVVLASFGARYDHLDKIIHNLQKTDSKKREVGQDANHHTNTIIIAGRMNRGQQALKRIFLIR